MTKGGCAHSMHSRSPKTIDSLIHTTPGRHPSDFPPTRQTSRAPSAKRCDEGGESRREASAFVWSPGEDKTSKAVLCPILGCRYGVLGILVRVGFWVLSAACWCWWDTGGSRTRTGYRVTYVYAKYDILSGSCSPAAEALSRTFGSEASNEPVGTLRHMSESRPSSEACFLSSQSRPLFLVKGWCSASSRSMENPTSFVLNSPLRPYIFLIPAPLSRLLYKIIIPFLLTSNYVCTLSVCSHRHTKRSVKSGGLFFKLSRSGSCPQNQHRLAYRKVGAFGGRLRQFSGLPYYSQFYIADGETFFVPDRPVDCF